MIYFIYGHDRSGGNRDAGYHFTSISFQKLHTHAYKFSINGKIVFPAVKSFLFRIPISKTEIF